jgi:glycosyltransferase involved in cell wall biosynthesis
MAKVSMIVPIYNVEKYLRRCLDSLLAQTFRDIEIICVNDGSKDGCAVILDEYVDKDSRINVVHQVNGGLSAARNTGLAHATSPYVMFLDSDDEYHPEMCARMFDAIKSGDCDFARCGVELVRAKPDVCTAVNDSYFNLSIGDGFVSLSDSLTKMIDSCVTNKIFRRDLIVKYNILFPINLIHEDSCFYLKYAMVSNSAWILSAKLYRYILRDNGIMSQQGKLKKQALDYIRILDDIYAFMQRNGLWEKKAELFFKFYAYFFNIAYHSMPGEFKDECYDLALPLLNKIGEREIIEKTDGAYKNALTSILKRDYVYFGRRYLGIGPLKLVKIVSKVSRFEVRLLGIPIYIKRYPYAPL